MRFILRFDFGALCDKADPASVLAALLAFLLFKVLEAAFPAYGTASALGIDRQLARCSPPKDLAADIVQAH